MFYAPGLFFGGREGVGSRFHVLRSRNLFRRYRGRRVRFSCFALPDSFWVVPRASGPVFIFCTVGPILGGTEGVGSSFHVLRSHTRFLRYRGCQVPFLYFALLDSFLEVPRAPGLVFMFFSFGLGFDGTEGVGSRFHFLCSQNSFWRYQVHRGLLFMFCAPELIFSNTEGIGSCFHVLRSSTRFGRYHGCRLLFSFIALPDLFFSGTAEYESGSAKHENGTRRTRYLRKRDLSPLNTAENESGSAKHENGS
jgi:hypothetical protein